MKQRNILLQLGAEAANKILVCCIISEVKWHHKRPFFAMSALTSPLTKAFFKGIDGSALSCSVWRENLKRMDIWSPNFKRQLFVNGSWTFVSCSLAEHFLANRWPWNEIHEQSNKLLNEHCSYSWTAYEKMYLPYLQTANSGLCPAVWTEQEGGGGEGVIEQGKNGELAGERPHGTGKLGGVVGICQRSPISWSW